MAKQEITPKYKVGEKVHCRRKETPTLNGFDFKGRIKHVNVVEDDMVEYEVENAPVLLGLFPCLVWEEEIVGRVEET